MYTLTLTFTNGKKFFEDLLVACVDVKDIVDDITLVFVDVRIIGQFYSMSQMSFLIEKIGDRLKRLQFDNCIFDQQSCMCVWRSICLMKVRPIINGGRGFELFKGKEEFEQRVLEKRMGKMNMDVDEMNVEKMR